MRRFWGTFLILAGAVGAYFSLYCLFWQDNAVRHFVPVEARVVRTEIRRHSGKTTTYSPEVEYAYTFGGRAYTSERVFPFQQNGQSNWANAILFRYQTPGAKTAYVNPEKPEESVLERSYAFLPYLLSLVTLGVAVLGVGLVLGVVGGVRGEMAAVPMDAAGTFLLLPNRSLKSRFRDAMGWLAGTVIVVTPLMLHWFLVAAQSSGYVFMAIEAGAVLLLLVLVLRRWRAARNLSDARVRVKPVPLVRGVPMALEMESDAFRALRVMGAQCAVACVEHYKERRGTKTYTGTRTQLELKAELCGEMQVSPGDMVSGRAVIVPDAASPPSTPPAQRSRYPYHTWEVRVKVTVVRDVDYSGVFPIEVV